MKTIHAIFEGGVFKPTEPIDLPDHCHVQFEPIPVGNESPSTPIPDLSPYRGILKDSPIDPLKYQRRIREEWA